MGYSTHCIQDRRARMELIKAIGVGEIVYRTTQVDRKRNKTYIYEISENAILTVRAYDEPTLIITQYQARPSRLLQYWTDCPQTILARARMYEKHHITF